MPGSLVRTAVAADAADEAGWQAGPAGRVDDADGRARPRCGRCTDGAAGSWLADLLVTTGGGGLAERPRIALTDALSGALLALTDLPGLRRAGTCGAAACRRDPARCTHDLAAGRAGPTRADRRLPAVGAAGPLGPRPGPALPVPRLSPAGAARRRTRPRPPLSAGPTSAGNLAGYCTGHHRGKHQAPGWRHELAPDGTLTVTTPTGLTAVTTPAALLMSVRGTAGVRGGRPRATGMSERRPNLEPWPTRRRTARRSAASPSRPGSTGSATPAAGSSTSARPRASASG